MTLYELTNEYQQLLDMAEDPDLDPEILADTMEALEGEIEYKADGYAKVIRQMTADAEALKVEAERLTRRQKVIEGNIKNLKDRLQMSMILMKKEKFKTDLFSFNIQNNPASVIMDEQYIENIPEEYLIPQDPKIDRKKIKEDIQSGKDLEGIAHLEQSRSLRIK